MAVASGCTTVTFPEPMPMNRKDHDTFPQSWQGTWTSHATSDNPGSDEILIIGEQTFRMPDGDPQILGRDAVLRKMGRHHVLSSPTEVDGITRWTVAVARMDGDQLRIVTFESPEQHHLHVWQELLGDERVEVQTKEGRDDKLKSVGLNPRNNRQFRKLLRHGTTTNHTFRQLVSFRQRSSGRGVDP